MRGRVFLRSEILVGDIAFGEPFLKVSTDDGRLLMVPLSAIDYIEIEKPPQRQRPQEVKG